MPTTSVGMAPGFPFYYIFPLDQLVLAENSAAAILPHMKAAIFLPNWLGDLAMSTPVLRALRRKFGRNARLVGIMRPYLADVLSGTAWLDEQWLFDPRAKDTSHRAWAVASRMRGEKFDYAILLTNSLRAAVMAWWAGAKHRVGYVRYGRGPFLNHKLYPHTLGGRILPEPVVDTYLAIADAVGCGRESCRLELATTEADQQSADIVFKRLRLRSDGRLILLNSSGAYGAAKLWPVEYFSELARRITAQCDHDVLVMCGPQERSTATGIVKYARSSRVFSMADQPMDLGTAKACISRGRLMVSTDSGPRHVAAALGKPVITLYGPMLPIWSENPTQRAINLALDLDCIGCHKHVCPLKHHNCMRELSVDIVYAAVRKMLESCRPVSRPHYAPVVADANIVAGPLVPHLQDYSGTANSFS
jgi:heptosyltransferase II